MFWQKDIETMSRKNLEALQLDRLKWIVSYCYQCVPFYRKKLDSAKITPDKIKILSDIKYIPFTTKTDIMINYPFDLFAQPMQKIVRLTPISDVAVLGYTKKDLNTLSDTVARIAVSSGVTEDDVVLLSFEDENIANYQAIQSGIEKIGATVISSLGYSFEKRLKLLKEYKATVIVTTPSFAVKMAKSVDNSNDIKLRLALFSQEDKEKSALMGAGFAGECHLKCGLHIAEDHFLPEIVDAKSGEVMRRGDVGELVVTTLTREGFPLLRYKTNDIAKINYDTCACGRTHARLERAID